MFKTAVTALSDSVGLRNESPARVCISTTLKRAHSLRCSWCCHWNSHTTIAQTMFLFLSSDTYETLYPPSQNGSSVIKVQDLGLVARHAVVVIVLWSLFAMFALIFLSPPSSARVIGINTFWSVQTNQFSPKKNRRYICRYRDSSEITALPLNIWSICASWYVWLIAHVALLWP